MKKQLWSAVMLCTMALVGCGEETPVTNPPANTDTGPKNTQAKINAALVGKTLTMTGEDIPSHPNGLDEDVDYAQATQCYHAVSMTVVNENTYAVVSELGTLRNVSNGRGECDHSPTPNRLEFTSSGVAIENVKEDGSCFDVTYSFPGGLVQEGRGQVSQDGKTLKLELYFQYLATGHRCADGAVGSNSVIIKGAPFTGNAVQTYRIQ
jgi:predicted small lipoprotein YifL